MKERSKHLNVFTRLNPPCPNAACVWHKPPPYAWPRAVLRSPWCPRWGAWCGAQTDIWILCASSKVVISINMFWERGVWTQTTTAWIMHLFLQVQLWQKPPRWPGTIFKQPKELLLIQSVVKVAVLPIRHRKNCRILEKKIKVLLKYWNKDAPHIKWAYPLINFSSLAGQMNFMNCEKISTNF